MKIGILSLVHGYNYGGMLQCYSLKRALESMGHNVEFINYHISPKWRLLRTSTKWLRKNQSGVLERFEVMAAGEQLQHKFGNFRETHLSLTKICDSHQELHALSESYEAMIVGSDQVWNFDWATDEFFFSFAQNYKGTLVSYGACFGHRNQPKKRLNEVAHLLLKIDHLSVRNDFSKQLVYEACGQEPLIVADPTLLNSQFELTALDKIKPREYILIYAMSAERLSKKIDHFKKFSEELGIPIILITSKVLLNWASTDIEEVIDPSIEEWLDLISNAKMVFTDSFHGAIVSMKSNTPFYNYINADRSSERFTYIAKRYGFENNPELGTGIEKYNQAGTSQKVQSHVLESLDFLRQL